LNEKEEMVVFLKFLLLATFPTFEEWCLSVED
jgi:hypothetical protein